MRHLLNTIKNKLKRLIPAVDSEKYEKLFCIIPNIIFAAVPNGFAIGLTHCRKTVYLVWRIKNPPVWNDDKFDRMP